MPAALVREFRDAMLNIHPGLLPAFGGKGLYGLRVHKAVIASGARFSGATVHFVDEEYDTGPILAQAIVPVLPYDTPQLLASRVLEQVKVHLVSHCVFLHSWVPVVSICPSYVSVLCWCYPICTFGCDHWTLLWNNGCNMPYQHHHMARKGI